MPRRGFLSGCLLAQPEKERKKKNPQKPCVLRSTLYYPRLYLQKK